MDISESLLEVLLTAAAEWEVSMEEIVVHAIKKYMKGEAEIAE